MEYARYSKESFQRLSPGSSEFVRLVTELQLDVMFELHAAVADKLREIVARLNEQGHQLREGENSKPGEIDYAEGERPNPFYLCCDTVISAGYLGTSSTDASAAKQDEWRREWTAEKR